MEKIIKRTAKIKGKSKIKRFNNLLNPDPSYSTKGSASLFTGLLLIMGLPC